MNQEDWSFIREEEIQEALIRFRKSLASGRKTYFDVSEFEGIVEYLLDEGDITTSEIAVLQGIQIHPGAVPLQLKYAQVLLSKGKYKAAIKYLKLAEQVEQTNTEIHLLKGLALLLLDKVAEAQKSFDKALNAADSDLDDILYHIGSSYIQVGDIDSAMNYLEQALEINPENELALYDLGYFSDKEGNYERSIEYYNRYLDIDPFNFSIWFNLGISYNKAGNYDKAVESYEYAYLLNEEFDQSLFNIGNAFANSGKFHEAISKYKEYLEIDPDNDDALCYIGECYLSLDDIKHSETYYRKSLAANPENDAALFGLGLLFWAIKKYQKAIDYVSKAIQLEDTIPEYWLTMAKIYKDMNLLTDAEEALSKAIELDTEDADHWITWIEIFLKKNDVDGAITACESGLKESDDSRLLYRMVSLHLEKRQFRKAYKVLQQAMEKDFLKISYLFDVYPKAINNKRLLSLIGEFRNSHNY